jgi:hypothetical protein
LLLSHSKRLLIDIRITRSNVNVQQISVRKFAQGIGCVAFGEGPHAGLIGGEFVGRV